VLYAEGALSVEQIRDAVLNVARYDLDGLREALLAGDVARLMRTLDGLQQEGEAPLLVLWAMTEEVRAWRRSGWGWPDASRWMRCSRRRGYGERVRR
jgi:DNA polymerase III delta subunit